MRTVLQPRGRPRWSVGVVIVLMLSLVGVALTHSSAAFGITDGATTRDYEIGDNDFRISDIGPDGNSFADAVLPKIAYNSTNHEYLVVWAGQDVPDGPFDIYAQRIDATTGAEVGENDFRVSQTGNEDNQLFIDPIPDVTYNSTLNEYMVVWEAEVSQGPDLPTIYGIYGQRLNAETGAAVGTDDFRVDLDTEIRDSDYRATDPAVIYNSTDDEYLVVWRGNLAEDRSFEITGQRLSATGERVGVNEFFISDMGSDEGGGDERFAAREPDVTYNATDNEYLVVWSGDDKVPPLVDNDFEIFGQRLAGATGTEVGVNDFRISNMGPDGNTNFNTVHPTVAYNKTAGEYLVAWSGGFDSEFDALEYGIYAQRLSAAGEERGDDFRVSDEQDGIGFWANYPGVAYNPTDNEYMITWALGNVIGGVDVEYEVYGQRLDGTSGAEVGDNDFRISDMGPEGNTDYRAFDSAMAYNSRDNEYMAVWSGTDDTAPLVDNEQEIFGQRLAWQPEATPTPPTPTATPPSATPTPTPEVPPVSSSRAFLPLVIR
ncbi:MAG: hypothetical protein GFH27_549291n68 [Chloroflexi bacterium AL-W]|nr:hypothetical protein [Chloroflexi bacterium AL-N1]NOK67465.1 hypothetical protein [Chloroflexi bacterium AL-N10]NOK75043.1 hypothetical protein [Chloroflexi bacterium AL-N5]NOK81830.1 hypothetical protein [Chloroflexi bacterium AL-W]NOK89676.1 hypothetical protein [Chloroflexi bacterium AL-N15]